MAALIPGGIAGILASRRVLSQSGTATVSSDLKTVDFDFRSGELDAPTLNGIGEGIGLYWIIATAANQNMFISIIWTEE